MYFFLFLKRSVQYIAMYSISVFPCCSVFFPIYGRKYSMKIKLFMENMWEFSLCFHFVPYKVNIPMNAGEFFYVIYLFHTKLIFPWMQGNLNKSNVSNIFVWYKLKFTFQTKPLWGFATVHSHAKSWLPFCQSLSSFFNATRKCIPVQGPAGQFLLWYVDYVYPSKVLLVSFFNGTITMHTGPMSCWPAS
jgi:hypothetical protein